MITDNFIPVDSETENNQKNRGQNSSLANTSKKGGLASQGVSSSTDTNISYGDSNVNNNMQTSENNSLSEVAKDLPVTEFTAEEQAYIGNKKLSLIDEDIKYSKYAPNNRFEKALTKDEWSSFFASSMKNNQRDGLRIGDHCVIVPITADSCKLVCYDNSFQDDQIDIWAVYKIENFDYNIHTNEPNILKFIEGIESGEISNDNRWKILDSYLQMSGAVLRKYNSANKRYYAVKRRSTDSRRNVRGQSDRGNSSAKNTESNTGKLNSSLSEVAKDLPVTEFTAEEQAYLGKQKPTRKLSLMEEQIKSATDNIGTYDSTNPDIRFQQRNVDPATLDDEQLKVYNNRGWSNGLFTKEDLILLNEKFAEMKTSAENHNVLHDGTMVADVNNKLVLVGGTFEDPQVHCVLVINADNETDAEFVKEYINGENYYDRNDVEKCRQIVQTSFGEKSIRVYSQNNFKYHKRRSETWKRAEIPSNFEHYGYTKQFQQRTGNSEETERSISPAYDTLNYEARDESDREILASALRDLSRNSREYARFGKYLNNIAKIEKESTIRQHHC